MRSPILCAQCLCKLNHLINLPALEPSHTITSRVRNGYNLPLSPMEIAEMNTFLIDGSECLSEYDTAIAEIEGVLLRLKNSRDSLQRRRDSAQYLISAPIRRLPPDVLHQIFVFFCEIDTLENARYGASGIYTLYIAEETSYPTLKLTWVCSFWRTFVQSCPNLWSSISLEAEILGYRPALFQILVKYLSHAANSLLDFEFSTHCEEPLVQEAAELLWNRSTRWRRAIIFSEQFLEAGATLMIKSLEPAQTQLSFSALKDLQIMPRDLSSEESSLRCLFLRCLSSCPRLRAVELDSLSWSGHNADFSCVTSLTLGRFVGKSFGHLLCRLPELESLEIREFEPSEDVDGGWAGSYRSSLRRLTALSSIFEPVAWRFVHLPYLADLTLELESSPSQDLTYLSSVLDDSQCQLENLRIYNHHFNDLQSQAAYHFIASQHSLTHLAISTRDVYPFVKFLQLQGDIIRNLRSLELNMTYSYNSQTLASICDVIGSRCTVHYSPDGNLQISGLQALTLNSDVDNKALLPLPVPHNRLALLKEAGFKFAGNMADRF